MEVFVTRRPVLDVSNETHGYELIAGHTPDGVLGPQDRDWGSLAAIDHAFFLQAVETLTDGKRAFATFGREAVLAGMAHALPRKSAVIDIDPEVGEDDDVLVACRQLKAAGYTLASTVGPGESLTDLHRLADIVRVDVSVLSVSDLDAATRPLRLTSRLLAANVTDDDCWSECVRAGFTLFTGERFGGCSVVKSTEIPPLKASRLQLMSRLSDEEVGFNELERIITADVGLTARLLTLINSAAIGLESPIADVRRAIGLIGLTGIRSWASVVVLRDLAIDRPRAVVVDALVRGAMCRGVATATALRARNQEMFLLGLFSRADLLVDCPLPQLIPQLPLAEDTRAALQGEDGPMRTVLNLVNAHEKGDWVKVLAHADEAGIDQKRVVSIHRESLGWADDVMREARL